MYHVFWFYCIHNFISGKSSRAKEKQVRKCLKMLQYQLFYSASQKVFGRDVYDPDMEIFQATHQWQTVKQGKTMLTVSICQSMADRQTKVRLC